MEYPAGTVKTDSQVQKVLSLTKRFPISLADNPLETWENIQGVSMSTTCTKETDTCRFSWVDNNNVMQTGTLEIYRDTGLVKTLIYSDSSTSAAATLPYIITEDTTNKRYIANGYITASDGSTFSGGTAELNYFTNELASSPEQKIALLFPLLLLTVCIVAALIDIGAIGIVIGSLVALIAGVTAGLLPLSITYLISFIVMGIILIYKLAKN